MRVADVMTRNVEVISPGASVREAARRMDELNVGALPVCDGRRLVGIITDRDITVRSTAAGEPPDRTRVQTIMTQDLRWCFDDTPVERAERMMSEVQIRRLPVVDHDGNLIGMLSLGDLATDHAPGAGEALRRISEPSEPDRREARGRSGESAGGRPRAGSADASRRSAGQMIAQEIGHRLHADPMLDATNVHVRAEGEEVTLAGSVGSEEDRRRAEEIARSVADVMEVRNELDIRSDVTMGNPTGITTGRSKG